MAMRLDIGVKHLSKAPRRLETRPQRDWEEGEEMSERRGGDEWEEGRR